MPLLDEIRDLIGDFYDGDLTPRQFREKFAPLFFQSDRLISEVHEVFINADALYAEFINGHLTEPELKKHLLDLVPSFRLKVEVPNDVSLLVQAFPFLISSNTEANPTPVFRSSGSRSEVTMSLSR